MQVVSVVSNKQNTLATPLTLGELLYADPLIACVPEKDWLTSVRAIAGGDEIALRALFERTYPLVFTYLMRMTGDRDVSENLILEVFEGIWCEAPVFDSASSPVLGWIMRQARSCALARVDGADPLEQSFNGVVASLLSDRADGSSRSAPRNPSLHVALEDLTAEEREILEAALIDGLPYAEVAEGRGESVGSIKSRVRSGLSKLRRALAERGGEA
jgi:RNA polymerase sigma-70 factor (ECF subfamily)